MARLWKSFLLLLALLLTLTACAAPVDAPTEAPQETVFPSIEPQDAPNRAEPLVNRHAYTGPQDVPFDVEQLYIKIYPTYNEKGVRITREEFEKHVACNKNFNPTLNAHLWQGDPADKANTAGRFGFDENLYNCTIRVRGNYSRGAPVKSFKVRLTQPGATLFSTDSLNLNKHIYDETRVANKTAMDLMQMIPSGLVSFETRFVRLFFNDVALDGTETGFVDQGLYIWIEQPNRDFLVNHGLDPNGSIYKPNIFEFSPRYAALRSEADPLYDQEAYEDVIKPMSSPDHEKLMEMLYAVNDYGRDYREVFNTYFDEENYLTWMAVNILFGNTDTLTHNMLLYSPAGSDKWYFLPWDYDEAMNYNEVYRWGNRYYQQFGIHYFWSVPLHQRYFRIEGNAQKLSAKMNELLSTTFTRQNFEQLSLGYRAVLDIFMARQPDIGMARLVEDEAEMPLEDEAEDSLSDLQFAQAFRQRYTDTLNARYQAVLNNAERYEVTLQYPSSIFMQEPEKTDDGWLFRWDASFDHQRDRLTYEFILSTGYTKKLAVVWEGYEQSGVLFHKTGLTDTSIIVPSLPEGPIFYRVLVHDEKGHIQYPRNNAVISLEGEMNTNQFYFSIGYFINE